ncbi:metallophosphoesterase [Weeksellaceae bacterium A-14]
MRRNLLIVTGFFILLELYVYQAFRTVAHHSWMRTGYWVYTFLLYALLVYLMMNINRDMRDQHRIQLIGSIFLGLVLPKLLVAVFLLVDDLLRLLSYGYSQMVNTGTHYPPRRKFLSILGLGAAGVFAGLIFDGIIFGKYRFRARKVRLRFKNLPDAFEGYRIVQISDVHSGSFFHPEKLQRAIDLINRQKADLILFTGDMVNNYAEEFQPFIPLFQSITAKDGKFSVLGNHDYGIYALPTEAEQQLNVLKLKKMEEEAGFTMLRNEHVQIEKNGSLFYLIGVENWGEKPFPQYGDLDKATEGIPASAFKILMSHDPTHFDRIVKFHPSDVQLTLSGHTHGMQFGIDLKNCKWSPVEYRYPKWIDLYESLGKYLYVNRGFGVIGYPGRVGIDPEITVFELAKSASGKKLH